MQIKKPNLKEVVTYLTTLSTLLMLVFGVSLTKTIGGFKAVFQAPAEIEKLFKSDSVFQVFLKESDHHHEMVWEMFRVMTDDDDTLEWYYVTEEGAAFDVDIRSTAEDVEFAFVYRTHEIFPVFISTADNRKYIVRHNGENKEYMTYLYKR
jgi:hypothetical protein